ncbi:MAG: ABC transporter substrate-binding protein [Spirochaetales bacterium]|nr:ABC transporter substrate-binding protein [Spirochaetales bacterium]
MKKLTLSLILTLFAAAFFVSCGNDNGETSTTAGGAMSEEDKFGGTLIRASWNPPSGNFLSLITSTDNDFLVTDVVFERLITINDKNELVPALAESWDIADDSKSVTFHLREGVKWHDGEEFDAEDVYFNWKFICDAGYTGPLYSNFKPIIGVEAYHNGEADEISGVEIIDDYTIKISFEEIYASVLTMVGTKANLIAEHVWAGIEPAKAPEMTEMLRNPVGTGPFKFAEFAADQYVSMVAFEDYWQGRPYLDKIIIKATNQDTAQAELLSGQINYMTVSDFNPDDMGLFESEGIQVLATAGGSYQFMGVNHQLSDFQDVKVRQALMYGIDRQGMVDNLLYGYGELLTQPLPTSSWAHPGLDKLNMYEYNPEKAIELLEEAGYSYKDGIMYKADGEQLKWVLKYPSGNKTRERSAPVIQQNLKDIGIDVELQIMEFSTMFKQLNNDDFELFLIGFGAGVEPDQARFWKTGAKYNLMNYENAENDRLIEEGISYIDNETRGKIYGDWAVYLNEDLPSIFLYTPQLGCAVSGNLRNATAPNELWYAPNTWYYAK